MVAAHLAAPVAPGGLGPDWDEHDPAGAAGRGQCVSAHPDVVPHGNGTAVRQRKSGPVRVVDPETEEKRDLIEHACRLAEQSGVPLWCQDEAGPYQAIPQPGAGWAP